MARIARIVMPEYPHHVIQRGNRRQEVFFSDYDREYYLSLLETFTRKNNVEVVAYCLMSNHVHLILVPHDEEGLCQAVGEMHRRYTRMINFREEWKGYLWQGRYKSYVMNEGYLYQAIRYIERNPVRAKVVRYAEEYQWSSARAHVFRERNSVLSERMNYIDFTEWQEYLREPDNGTDRELFKKHESTGRPIGDDAFIIKVETSLNRVIRKQKPGPKPKVVN